MKNVDMRHVLDSHKAGEKRKDLIFFGSLTGMAIGLIVLGTFVAQSFCAIHSVCM